MVSWNLGLRRGLKEDEVAKFGSNLIALYLIEVERDKEDGKVLYGVEMEHSYQETHIPPPQNI